MACYRHFDALHDKLSPSLQITCVYQLTLWHLLPYWLVISVIFKTVSKLNWTFIVRFINSFQLCLLSRFFKIISFTNPKSTLSVHLFYMLHMIMTSQLWKYTFFCDLKNLRLRILIFTETANVMTLINFMKVPFFYQHAFMR